MTLFKQSALAAAVCLALAPAAFAQQSGTTSTPAADAGSTSSTAGAATPSSDEVRQVQEQLKEKGIDVGAVDGIMGPKTRAALKSFQQKEGLTASGELDSSTLTALGIQGSGSTMDSSTPAAGGAAPSATGGSSSTSPSGAAGGSPSSTSPSGGSTGSSPSDSGSTGTMPKQ